MKNVFVILSIVSIYLIWLNVVTDGFSRVGKSHIVCLIWWVGLYVWVGHFT